MIPRRLVPHRKTWSLRSPPLISIICGIFAYLLLSSAYAQRAIFLAIQGDGTASVVIDSSRKAAWITDGGRGGRSGIVGARIDGMPVLKYLMERGVKTLAITCSHPHDDHMGGLKALVADPLIRNFQLRFVDNGISEQDRLFAIYEKAVGADFAAAHAKYESAANRNAFVDFATGSAGDIEVSNFQYDATSVGGGVHDTSVLMQYKIKGTPPRKVVDFDDASTELINTWVASGGTADAIVYPHHGSRNNSIDGVLAKRRAIGVRDVVITVNRQNRFLHPSSEKLLEMLRTFQPEHIFITDSDLGENVTIDRNGVSDGRSKGDHIARLRDFIEARIQMHSAAVRKLLTVPEEDILAETNISETQAHNARIEAQIARSGLSARRANAVRSNIGAVRNYREALSLLDGKGDRNQSTFLAGLVGGGDFDPPLTLIRNQHPPTGPSGGSGRYLDSTAKLPQDIELHAGLGSPAFEAEKARHHFTWGGIVLGNAVAGPIPSSMTFVIAHPADTTGLKAELVIHVVLKNGAEGDYLDATSDELWAAYNFVSPTKQLVKRYPGRTIRGNMAGVVGLFLHNNDQNTREVALHPALAGTQIGWDAMRADHVLIAAQQFVEAHKQTSVGPTFQTGGWTAYKDFGMLQWNDAPSHIVVRNGLVSVLPTAGPEDCLLRVRLAAPSEDNEWHLFTNSIDAKLTQQATSTGRVGTLASANRLIASSKVSEALDEMQKKEPKTPRWVLQRMAVWSLMAEAGVISEAELKSWYKSAENQADSSDAAWTAQDRPGSDIEKLCTGYRPLVEVDHLARLIALLNWYSHYGIHSLPPLPDSIQPVWRPTPDVWDTNKLLFVGGRHYTH